MRIIAFDTETGGLLDCHPTIQLAAVAVDLQTWAELASFECKIRFDEADADAKALELNHYDPEVWKREAVPLRTACEKFSAFIEPHRSLQMISKRTGRPYSVARLIGHNAATFDGPRVKLMYQQTGLFLPADPRILCTVQRALWYFQEHSIEPPANYQLGTLCRYFGIPVDENAHEALFDVRLTVRLAHALQMYPQIQQQEQEAAVA